MSRSAFSFFSTVPAPTEIYTLSLHDALPISICQTIAKPARLLAPNCATWGCHLIPSSRTGAESRDRTRTGDFVRSEEHTSELQSHSDLVCRLLLEKKKKKHTRPSTHIRIKPE